MSNQPISTLPAAAALTGPEKFAAVQSGATVAPTATQIDAFCRDSAHVQTVGDANATISAGVRIVLLTAALTAPRTYTLPAANASGQAAGDPLLFVDTIGTLTGTNTATIARAGSDTINGGASGYVLATPYAQCELRTDAVSRWEAVGGFPFVQFAGPTAARTYTLPDFACSLGFLGYPQNSQSAAYTLVAADSGKAIYHPSADTTARTWTIPSNASVPFAIGTVVLFQNDNGAGVITIAITTDTLRLTGAGTTGSRTLAANGMALAMKMTSTSWQITNLGGLT